MDEEKKDEQVGVEIEDQAPGAPIERKVEDTDEYNPDFWRFSDFLGVNWESRRDNTDKLEALWEWSKKQVPKGKLVDGMEAVRNLKRKLGLSVKGSELIKELYQYIRLDAIIKKLEAEQEAIKKEMELYGS